MTTKSKLPEPRKAILTPIIDPQTGEQIDRGLLLWFPGPNSFTGEDCCELQVHGGPAVISGILGALSKLPFYRPAAPGEFTKRAFIAGKMDLTEVEGLADLIHAETEQQRRQALLQMEGSLARLYGQWRTKLLRIVAHVEAYIDFSEEENIEDDILETTRIALIQLSDEVDAHLQDGRKGELLKNGVRTAIIGEPNVGKSSLLNLLVGRAAAIVTPVAGTTRDVVEVPINIGGFPLVLADTAGQRQETQDEVEREGIRRAQIWSSSADLAIMVVNAEQVLTVKSWSDFYKDQLTKLKLSDDIPILPLINKIDLLNDKETQRVLGMTENNALLLSCTTLQGFDEAMKSITGFLQKLCGSPSRESPTLTQARHRHHLSRCHKDLQLALTLLSERDASIAAHSLRKALKELGHITGHVTTEQILDVVFHDFCVGK